MFEGLSYNGISDVPQDPRMVWDGGDPKAGTPPTLPGCSKVALDTCRGDKCAIQGGVRCLSAAHSMEYWNILPPNPCMCCCAVLRSPQGLRKGLTLISFALNFISCKFNANAARTRPSSAVLRAGQDLAQDRGIIPGK